MTYAITDQCIACDRCISACPAGAICIEGQTRRIDAALCNGCVGTHGVPQCFASCPTNEACVPNPQDYWDRWFIEYKRAIASLRQTTPTSYWDKWYALYTQKLEQMFNSRQQAVVEVKA